MRDRIRRAAESVGRDPDGIRCVYNLEVRLDPEQPLSGSVISGGAEEVAARLREFVKLGFAGFNLITVGAGLAEQRARLAKEVLPAVRDG